MDSLDIARACVRRWYVFVPILVLAIGGGYKLADSRPVKYQADAAATVYFPSSPTPTAAPRGTVTPDPRADNALYTTGGVGLIITSLVADMNSPAIAKTLAQEGHTSAFTVVSDHLNGHLIDVQAQGSSPTDALATASALVGLTDKRLVALQERLNTPAASQFHTIVVIPASLVSAKPPSKFKFVAAMTGVGVLLGAVLVLLFEGILRRRNEARSEWAAAVPDEDDEDDLSMPELDVVARLEPLARDPDERAVQRTK